MGTQTAIAQEIVAKGGDYILSLKGNAPRGCWREQRNLHEDVQQLFDWALQSQFKDIAHEYYQSVEKGHGRIERRRYWLLSEVEHLIDAERWVGL